MMIEVISKKKEKILMYVAFAFFFSVTCYKLTNAPLWFDETVEYWYSKIMFGKLPFNGDGLSDSTNMYQRILSTYQPPLYNFLMFFWLKISTREFWFRFFGVIMGFVGNMAIYKSVKTIGNGYIAALSVFFTSCVYQLVYYWQECAEYCLMLASLCWTIYFFICFINEQSLRNIVLLTIFAVVPIYSQYGATFPVVSMLILAYVLSIAKKNKATIARLSLSYIIAFLVAALPLLYFFLLRQMKNQEGKIVIQGVQFEKNIIYDLLKNFAHVFYSTLLPKVGITSIFIVSIFVLAGIVVLLFSRQQYAKYLVITNITTYIFYYVSVKLNLYAYGSFGGRYCLFFIPIWIVSIFCFGIEITEILKTIFKRIKNLDRINAIIATCMIACFMMVSWQHRLRGNWEKDDMRGAVNQWLECDAEESNTIVYYAGDSGFLYYLRHTENYTEDMERNVHYMDWYSDRTVEEYSQYVDSIYGDNWPKEVYIIASHTSSDLWTLTDAFTDKGYSMENIFDHYDGKLIKMSIAH